AQPTVTVEYVYDVFGRRITKTVNGDLRQYVYDGEDRIWTLDQNSQVLEGITHGPGINEPIVVQEFAPGASQTLGYVSDWLGSVTQTFDWNSGDAVSSLVYDSYGRRISVSGSPSETAFTGREWDEETGLYAYRARYYDPEMGRFTQEDFVGFGGYQYVNNNPLTAIDPFGLLTLHIRYNPKVNYVQWNAIARLLQAELGSDVPVIVTPRNQKVRITDPDVFRVDVTTGWTLGKWFWGGYRMGSTDPGEPATVKIYQSQIEEFLKDYQAKCPEGVNPLRARTFLTSNVVLHEIAAHALTGVGFEQPQVFGALAGANRETASQWVSGILPLPGGIGGTWTSYMEKWVR
ncbi:MAG: RHS repeat-associated core domain-containing protein, partial [Armatimonadetes bacterium]|nr:RHS repeat-associated core domain-containing protein [Armatimonadota bacterium]